MLKRHIGEKFNMMEVIGEGYAKKYNNGKIVRMVTCRCDCGTVKDVLYQNLKRNNTKSCGCYAKNEARKLKTTHGMKGTPTYGAWRNMKTRTPKENRWSKQGKRICEWRA